MKVTVIPFTDISLVRARALIPAFYKLSFVMKF